jgi:hypothetical protein
MASKVYNKFKQRNAAAEIDLNADPIWIALLMSNTTADTDNDGDSNVGDLTTLDECDGANYVRKELGSLAVNLDDANDRAEFDAADVTWTALGNGTRQIVGVLIYKDADDDGDPADDANNPLIAWIEFASPVNPGGADFTIQWNAEGILQLA